ncbi:MAG: hypothetical protein COS84_01250 [Armatimonadetes bacterium CG07_land_8_20_14_0_80_40_9]|nr:MAG: hypothetical protein COS84_01250 [Armatimonadetes bacterium CG07_land_8_20_14_0_80_40_9]
METVLQILLTIIGAFLSVVLTKFLIQNGRKIDEVLRKMDEGFKRMDERTMLIAKLIVTEGEERKKLVESLS